MKYIKVKHTHIYLSYSPLCFCWEKKDKTNIGSTKENIFCAFTCTLQLRKT